jgi:hypothetical protein
VSTESELSTEDLARSGQARQDEGRTPGPRGEGMPDAGEGQATRPPGERNDASAHAGSAPGMPQERPGYEQRADAVDPRDSGTVEAAQQPDRPEPAPDRLGGGAGDQGAETRPGGREEGMPPAGASAPGAATLGESSAPDSSGHPPADRRTGEPESMALLGPADEERFRQRWGDAQARFVDDPQEAVRTADGLVAELMQALAQGFSEHKGRLEAQWQRGGNPDTEELRQALQRYRSFFDRLLST